MEGPDSMGTLLGTIKGSIPSVGRAQVGEEMGQDDLARGSSPTASECNKFMHIHALS